MKKKLSGFTLVELLVVIVIISILGTITIPTFGKYFAKTRDAVRQNAITQMAELIRTDSVSKWKDQEKYIYTGNELTELFANSDFRVPEPKNLKNYIYMAGNGASHEISEDNQFFIAVMGEKTSTAKPGTPGLIYSGTKQIEDVLKNIDLENDNNDFSYEEDDDTADLVAFKELLKNTHESLANTTDEENEKRTIVVNSTNHFVDSNKQISDFATFGSCYEDTGCDDTNGITTVATPVITTCTKCIVKSGACKPADSSNNITCNNDSNVCAGKAVNGAVEDADCS